MCSSDLEFATAEAVTLTSTSPTPWPGGVDLDGDGDEETWEMGSWTRVAWDGAATAAVEPTPPDLYTRYAQAHAADLDGDGDAELLVENATRDASDLGGEALALGGVGETGWPTSWTDLVDTVGADVVRAVAMDGDLTGDGPADLVLVDAAGVRVWAWDGAAFAEVASTDLAWAATAPDTTVRRWLAESDDDGDGDIDLLLGLNGEEAAQVFLNDGAGSFRLGERVSVPASLADSTANVEDLDGDGRLEAWSVADDLQGWRDGASGWEALDTSYVAFGPYAAARDLDGDGAADVVGASGDRVYVVWGTREDVVLTCE